MAAGVLQNTPRSGGSRFCQKQQEVWEGKCRGVQAGLWGLACCQSGRRGVGLVKPSLRIPAAVSRGFSWRKVISL